MKDYPYFKAYVAEILFDTMGMSQAQKGDYLDSLLLAWKDMNPEKMPRWMQEYADDTIKKSAKLSVNSRIRWEKAMQLHSKSNPDAMQIPYIEDRIGEDRIGEERDILSKKNKVFIPPTLSEAHWYVEKSELNGFDVEAWHKSRTATQWKKANGKKVKDWKLDIRGCIGAGSFIKQEAGRSAGRVFETTKERINRENMERLAEMAKEQSNLFGKPLELGA
jgi:hypothetical protein